MSAQGQKRKRQPTIRSLLAFLLLGIGVAAEARNDDTWELGEKQFQEYEATAGSPLVKKLFAEPIDRGLERAEVARVALNIMRRTEEARLLNEHMEHDVVAELLGLQHRKTATVGEAIAQQRSQPTPVSEDMANRAMRVALERGALSNGRGRVFLHERHVMFSPDGISFGYPGNEKDSPRAIAHELLFSSTCADRGTCSSLSAFFQSPLTRAAIARLVHFLAVLTGGALLVWAIIRAIAWLPYGGRGNALARPVLGFLIAPPIPVLLWFFAALFGIFVDASGWGLGLLAVPIYGIPISYAVAAALLVPIVLVLRRHERLSFMRVVLAATAIALIVPPVWMYLLVGSFFGSFSGSVANVLYALSLSILFGLVAWPTVVEQRPTQDSAPHPLRSQFAWFIPMLAVHAVLLAFGYGEGIAKADMSSSTGGGILDTSLAPRLAFAWLDPPVLAVWVHVQLAWCALVWSMLYWLLAGLMVRLTAREASWRQAALSAS